MSDPMDHIIHALSERLDQWSKAQEHADDMAAILRQFEAQEMVRLMSEGMAENKAKNIVQAMNEHFALRVQADSAARVASEFQKRIRLGEHAFEAQRSREATARRVGG